MGINYKQQQKINRKIISFYREFYNNRFLRDFVFIIPKSNLTDRTGKRINTKIPAKTLEPNTNYSKKFLYWIFNNHNGFNTQGNLYAGLNYFKTIPNYNNRDYSTMYTDKLFFDFDTENQQLKEAKQNVIAVYDKYTGKQLNRELKEVQEQYIKILNRSTEFKQTYKEAKKLYNEFVTVGFKPLILFSGSKGFHLYLIMKEQQLEDYTNTNIIFYNNLIEKYNFNSLDYAVFNKGLAVKHRVPYSKHSITGLYTMPISITEMKPTEIIDYARELTTEKIVNFDYNSYMDPAVNILMEHEKQIAKIKQDYNKKLYNQIKQMEAIPNNNGNKKDNIFNDVRELAKYLMGKPAKEYPAKNYNMYNCIFHNDRNPSAKVNKKYFSCYSCNLKYNYFDLIKHYFQQMTNKEVSNNQVKEIMKKILNNETPSQIAKEINENLI